MPNMPQCMFAEREPQRELTQERAQERAQERQQETTQTQKTTQTAKKKQRRQQTTRRTRTEIFGKAVDEMQKRGLNMFVHNDRDTQLVNKKARGTKTAGETFKTMWHRATARKIEKEMLVPILKICQTGDRSVKPRNLSKIGWARIQAAAGVNRTDSRIWLDEPGNPSPNTILAKFIEQLFYFAIAFARSRKAKKIAVEDISEALNRITDDMLEYQYTPLFVETIEGQAGNNEVIGLKWEARAYVLDLIEKIALEIFKHSGESMQIKGTQLVNRIALHHAQKTVFNKHVAVAEKGREGADEIEDLKRKIDELEEELSDTKAALVEANKIIKTAGKQEVALPKKKKTKCSTPQLETVVVNSDSEDEEDSDWQLTSDDSDWTVTSDDNAEDAAEMSD